MAKIQTGVTTRKSGSRLRVKRDVSGKIINFSSVRGGTGRKAS